ncbi:uncharacterized protein BKA78DRAFT_23554 [Phyllosticta capitalensis]|uniref:uncharacterized protein n=1 Tax=Phyllosticta capitalensis TaxID=121624 RepID=UPI00312EF556
MRVTCLFHETMMSSFLKTFIPDEPGTSPPTTRQLYLNLGPWKHVDMEWHFTNGSVPLKEAFKQAKGDVSIDPDVLAEQRRQKRQEEYKRQTPEQRARRNAMRRSFQREIETPAKNMRRQGVAEAEVLEWVKEAKAKRTARLSAEGSKRGRHKAVKASNEVHGANQTAQGASSNQRPKKQSRPKKQPTVVNNQIRCKRWNGSAEQINLMRVTCLFYETMMSSFLKTFIPDEPGTSPPDTPRRRGVCLNAPCSYPFTSSNVQVFWDQVQEHNHEEHSSIPPRSCDFFCNPLWP